MPHLHCPSHTPRVRVDFGPRLRVLFFCFLTCWPCKPLSVPARPHLLGSFQKTGGSPSKGGPPAELEWGRGKMGKRASVTLLAVYTHSWVMSGREFK